MTFCLAMKVKDGLVAVADTCVTSGSECITARKVSVYEREGGSLFLMTSGLRAVRDKALTYFDEIMEDGKHAPPERLFKVTNLFARQIRRVAEEDKKSLVESGFEFNIRALVGGQMSNDHEHKLYLIYPEGNWVEIGAGTPYHIIGASGYGKPVLDRTLKYDDAIRFALKVGCLAFDSTRISAADVGFPLDVLIYVRDTHQIVQHRYEEDELAAVSNWWQERLRQSMRELPIDWMQPLLSQLPDGVASSVPSSRESAPSMDAIGMASK